MMTSASATASSTEVDTRTPSRSMPGGTSVGGPLSQTSAPSLVSSSTFDRSTRLCSRSPTIAILRPSMRCLCWRMVNASSSACVGCSCMPSPALMISRAADPRQQMAGARRGVAQHDHVRRHRLDVHRGVGQRLALEHARRRHGDVQRVGAEPLLGDLERGPRPRARLVEQVDDRLAAQRRHLLDRPLADLAHRLGGVEDAVDLVGRQVGDAEQVLLHPSISTSSRPSISVSRTCTLCDGEVGRFLPT